MQSLSPDCLRKISYYLSSFDDILSLCSTCRHIRRAVFHDSKERVFIAHHSLLSSHPEKHAKPKYWLLYFYTQKRSVVDDVSILTIACMFGFDIYVKQNVHYIEKFTHNYGLQLTRLIRSAARYCHAELCQYLVFLPRGMTTQRSCVWDAVYASFHDIDMSLISLGNLRRLYDVDLAPIRMMLDLENISPEIIHCLQCMNVEVNPTVG